MSKITFKKFLEKHINCSDGYVVEMSKIKRESPELYQKYMDRIRTVEDFHMQNENRGRSSFWKPLTVETFYETEKYYNSMARLLGRTPTDTTE